jgi:hypothetical protein
VGSIPAAPLAPLPAKQLGAILLGKRNFSCSRSWRASIRLKGESVYGWDEQPLLSSNGNRDDGWTIGLEGGGECLLDFLFGFGLDTRDAKRVLQRTPHPSRKDPGRGRSAFSPELQTLSGMGVLIRLLVAYFIDRYARKAGKRIATVDKKALR